MNDHELLRVIRYVEQVRQPFHALVPLAEPDPVWNMVVHLVRAHVRQDVVTVSKLAGAAGVPYATAMRRIRAMTEHGLIRRTPTGRTGKTFGLHPSDALLEAFVSYAGQVKSLVAQTVGVRPHQDTEDAYYFGGARMEALVPPSPALLRAREAGGPPLRFLGHADNYFTSLQNLWADYRNNLGSRGDFDLRALPDLHARLVENARAAQSAYDVVALNIPWLGEAVAGGFIRPAEAFLSGTGINPLDFDAAMWATGRWGGRQHAVPLFCSVELMAVREDLFAQNGLALPRRFADVLAAGRAFHAPRRGRYGITWNGQRGMPLASSFAFLLGCCGGAVLGLPRDGTPYATAGSCGAPVPVTLDTEAARAALDYMHELVAISPPDVLEMGWNAALELFMSGRAAMTYCWSMRASRLEYDPTSKVKRRVRYLAQPAGPGGGNVCPLGGFLLAVPANLPEARVRAAFEVIRWMTPPDAVRPQSQARLPVLPRFSLGADPEIAAGSPIVRAVNRLAGQGALQTWQRPPLPEYSRIEAVLGDEIHSALTRRKDDLAALRSAQGRIERILGRKAGRRLPLRAGALSGQAEPSQRA